MADMQEKAFALLLAVIGDVDFGLGLLVDDPAQRLLAEPVEFARIDRFAAGAAHMQPGQFRRTRQAAGVRRQNAVFAAAHGRLPLADRLSAAV